MSGPAVWARHDAGGERVARVARALTLDYVRELEHRLRRLAEEMRWHAGMGLGIQPEGLADLADLAWPQDGPAARTGHDATAPGTGGPPSGAPPL